MFVSAALKHQRPKVQCGNTELFVKEKNTLLLELVKFYFQKYKYLQMLTV